MYIHIYIYMYLYTYASLLSDYFEASWRQAKRRYCGPRLTSFCTPTSLDHCLAQNYNATSRLVRVIGNSGNNSSRGSRTVVIVLVSRGINDRPWFMTRVPETIPRWISIPFQRQLPPANSLLRPVKGRGTKELSSDNLRCSASVIAMVLRRLVSRWFKGVTFAGNCVSLFYSWVDRIVSRPLLSLSCTDSWRNGFRF